MNQRDAKRDACSVVARLIDNYFDVGQPLAECSENNPKHPDGEDECPDCHRQYKALEQLRDEMDRRSQGAVPVSWQRETKRKAAGIDGEKD